MKASNANKVVSVLLSVAMCPMMVPSAAFAADDDAALGASSPIEQAQSADQTEAPGTSTSSSDTIAPQSESANASVGEAAPAAEANGEGAEAAPSEEGTETDVAEVNGKSYSSLQAAIDAASRNATVKLLADTTENVTISTPYVTLDLNGHTLNGGTEKGKPALTVTARVTVMDSSEAQTGTIMREDTAENSGVSSHYVIDIQGAGWLTFESGNVTNNSGNTSGKGASLVRVGDDSVAKYPGLNIKGGTFTQDNFIVIKVDRGDLFLNGGTLNSANSYAIEDWHRATIKGGTVNGAVAAWTYSGGLNSDLTISGGTVNGDVKSVTYDGAEGKTAKVAITGGVVNGTLNTVDYSTGTTSNDPAKATIEVTGGTFSTNPSRYLVEGSAATQNADGTYGVAKAYLAQVGETSYYTMDEAFKAQTASGEAITLLRDYTTGSTFNSGTAARVVDLNGHTWTCTGTDANSAAFEINYPNASLTVKNGKVVSSQLIGLIPSASGGTITYDNSTLTFEGVETSTTATSGIETNGNNTNDAVVLKNSTLNVPNGFGIYFPSSGTLTIDNSTINAKTMGAQVCSGNLNVTAGSAITVSGDPVEKLEGDGAIQDGAAISIVNRPGYKGLGQVNITGGTFTAKGNNAAIKAYTWNSSTKQESAFDNSAKTVAVSAGTFSSAVASDLCAEGYAPVANTDGTYSVGVPVAQIGGNVFISVQAAIDAAQAGETVQLLADAVVDDTVIVQDKGAITLDLNGKTISNTKEIWNEGADKWSLISVRGNSDLTITGNGAIDALANDSYAIDLYDAASKCTIENGAFTGNISAVYIYDGALTINGGTFDIKQLSSQGDHRFTINCFDSSYKNGTAQVSINGGTFNGFDPANNLAEGTGTAFTAPGYTTVANADGTYSVAAGVAQVAGKAFTSLQAAIDAAQDGETVTLLADATEDVAISKSITLDLGGKTLTNTNNSKATISVQSGIVAVKNGNVVGGTGYYNIEVTKDSNANLTLTDVTATAGNNGSSMIDNYGTLTITSGTYTGGLDTVKNEPNAKLTISGGEFTLTKGTSKGFTGVVFNYGALEINGGTFIQSDKSAPYGQAQVIHTDKSGSATPSTVISGGTFKNLCTRSTAWAVRATNAAAGATQVSGGTFNKKVTDSYCANGLSCVKNADGTYGVAVAIAQIGSVNYASLQDAINAAKSRSTVKLLTDIVLDAQAGTESTLYPQFTISGKKLTLDMQGHKISYSEESRTKNYGKASLLTLSIDKGSDVTITGNGTIDTELGSNQAYGINILGGSNLTINNGTFYGAMTAVQVQKGGLVINDGTFLMAPTCKEQVPQYAKYIINCLDAAWKDGSATVSIKGGTFGHDYSHSPEGEGTSYLAPGYAPVDNGDGTYGVVAGVAQIGKNAYASVQAAIDAAQDGETVQLLNDAAENVTIDASKQITLDLNGYTLNGGTGNAKAAILNKGNVTITDTSADKTGTIKRDDQGIAGETSYYVIDNNGTMVIDQANVFNNSGAKGSSLIRNGGVDTVSSLTINGGTFEQQNFIAVKNDSNGELTINGGTLTSKQSVVQNWNKAQILGGNLTGIIWTDSWTEAGTVGETVIGGDAQFTGTIYMDVTGPNPSTLKIEGGSLDVTKWTVTDAAAKANATIAVSGGTFTAAVPENYCAAGYVPATNADGTYGVAVGKFTVQVTSRTTTSDSPVANVSGGGSDVTYADGTTVTASAISGYKFVGWFVNEYAGTPYSTDLTCTVKPTDNCTMIAVYEPVSGGKFWLSVTASEFTVNGGAVQDSYLYEQYAIGASVTVNFTGSENFLYWVNASNKVVSTNKSYTFTMGSETALKAVYGKARQNQATVVFVSHSDQIISSKAYTTNDTIQFPVPPIKMGCTFTGWSMTEDQIHAAMASNGGIIEVRALYTEPSMACKVTVVYPDGNDNEVVNTKVGQLVNVTAKDIKGKTFSHWTDNDGNVLGYTKTLKLAPSGDMTVKAIYSDGATEAKPVISMTAVDTNTGNGYYLISFTATRAVPEGYELVKQGVLYSIDSRCAGDAGKDYLKLTADGTVPEGVYESIGSNNDLNGVTRVNCKVRTADTTLYGRGYMILKNKAGEVLYVYTDGILSGSYNSLNNGGN